LIECTHQAATTDISTATSDTGTSENEAAVGVVGIFALSTCFIAFVFSIIVTVNL